MASSEVCIQLATPTIYELEAPEQLPLPIPLLKFVRVNNNLLPHPRDDYAIVDPYEGLPPHAPGTYSNYYGPDLLLHYSALVEPVQPPLPIAGVHERLAIHHAIMGYATWPPQADKEEEHVPSYRMADMVDKIAQRTENPDRRTALLIGMMATIHSSEIKSNLVLQDWGLISHLGMAHALGAAMAADLHISERALRQAGKIHAKYFSRHVDPEGIPGNGNGRYPALDGDRAFKRLKRITDMYWQIVAEEGVQGQLDYFESYLDCELHRLPPGRQTLAYCSSTDAAHLSAYDAYMGILHSVELTRSNVRTRKPELETYLSQQLAYIEDHAEERNTLLRNAKHTADDYVSDTLIAG